MYPRLPAGGSIGTPMECQPWEFMEKLGNKVGNAHTFEKDPIQRCQRGINVTGPVKDSWQVFFSSYHLIRKIMLPVQMFILSDFLTG